MNLKEVHESAKKHNLNFVDIKFIDMPGTWQHFTVPLHELDESAVAEGLGFDGSSIRGFQEINESDMLLMPDLSTAIIDPFSTGTRMPKACTFPSSSGKSRASSVPAPLLVKRILKDPAYPRARAPGRNVSIGVWSFVRE